MPVKPNQRELNNGCPTMTLGGVEWPVPALAIKQLRQLTPIITRYFQRFKDAANTADVVSRFDESMITDLLDIVFIGLTKAHPDISRDEFEEMSVSLSELREAVMVVVQQTGLFVPSDAQKKMTNQETLTGTASSPQSSPPVSH
jgi:hypothetical protein